MPFTFKLSRRLALLEIAAVAVAISPACTADVPSTPNGQLQLSIAPRSVTIEPLEHVQFTASARAADGQPARIGLKATLGSAYASADAGLNVEWSATGGVVANDGRYAAGASPGEYLVIVTSPNYEWSDTAIVVVTSEPLAPVASVAVTPANASLLPGSVVRLSVVLRDASGQTVSGRPVTWTSADTTVATVAGDGSVYGVAEGSAEISATSGAASGTATVTVTREQVAAVLVSPGAATMPVGGTLQLGAETRNAANDVLAGRVVTWSSDDPTVASVDPAGLVVALAPGSVTIAALSDGVTGTADVTVEASGDPALTRECDAAQPAWIWCDDFEQDRFDSYFEYDDQDGDFVPAAGVGVEGSVGMRARWPAVGQVGAGALKVAFGKVPSAYFQTVDAGSAKYRELYWRMYLKHEAGWTGGGGYKLSRATVFASPNWAQAMFAHVWNGGDEDLVIDPASGTDEQGNLKTTTYNDFANMRWLGGARSQTQIFDADHVGRWYCIEAHARLNDAGQSNGTFDLWIDGALEGSRSGLNWLGAYEEYGINAVFFENWWNGGSAAAQERYFDNLVISTERIGCGNSAPPSQEPVSSVSVSPASLFLEPSQSAQLSAEPRDAAGNALSGRTVTWSSNAPTVVAVSASGLVTARETGGAVITARSEGKIGTASVTVTESPPPPPPSGTTYPNEPAGYTPFAEHDFSALPPVSPSTGSGGIRAGRWSRKADPDPDLSIVSDPSAPLSASEVLRSRWPIGQEPGRSPFTVTGWDARGFSVEKREIYWSMRLKIVGGFQMHGAGVKFGFWGTGNKNGNNELLFWLANDGAGHNGVRTDLRLRFTNQMIGRSESPNRNTAKRLRSDRWHHIEMVMKQNDIGVANGVLKIWIDGVLIHEWNNFTFRDAQRPHGFQQYRWSPIWGGVGGANMTRENIVLVDHIYMSGVDLTGQ